MFLAFIGLQYQEGIGAVTADPSTLVTLGELHGPVTGPYVCWHMSHRS